MGPTRSLILTAVAAGLLGCPSSVEAPAKKSHAKSASVKETPADDPRVEVVNGDLYDKDGKSNPVDPPPPAGKPGSGKPDETNGVCRLFDPKMPEPQCCAFETGFDAEFVRTTCGFDQYLGESVRNSCGYFFMNDPAADPTSAAEQPRSHQIRITVVSDTDPRAPAERHVAGLKKGLKKTLEIVPVPGVDGAWQTDADDGKHHYYWAWLPGWSNVRQVSWVEESCPSGKMNEVLKAIAAAAQPTAGAERLGLLPQARKG